MTLKIQLSLVLGIVSVFIGPKTAAQNDPDSVVIQQNTYYAHWLEGTDDMWLTTADCLYRSESYRIVKNKRNYKLNRKTIGASKVRRLNAAIKNSSVHSFSVSDYGIDTSWIKTHSKEMLERYSNKKDFSWNSQQRQYMNQQLGEIDQYQRHFLAYIEAGCCYGIHRNYRDELIIRVFRSGKVENELTSRKRNYGFYMPWTNAFGDTIADHSIEKELAAVVTLNNIKPMLQGERLLKYLAEKIIEYHKSTLYQLEAYTFEEEIKELETDFKIKSFEELYTRGRYVWDEPSAFKIVLANDLMRKNVRLDFVASERNGTLYSRDSIKRDYRGIVQRVQSIDFITKFFEQDTLAQLDIYYFNNRGINKYNIESVNSNPEKWAKHDKYVKSLDWYKQRNISPSFDIDEAIATSRQLECGCNYRFDQSFIEKSIFFEIHDRNGNSSIWFLLPDDRVLLYLMQGEKVLEHNYAEFGKSAGLQYPCVMFDSHGNQLAR